MILTVWRTVAIGFLLAAAGIAVLLRPRPDGDASHPPSADESAREPTTAPTLASQAVDTLPDRPRGRCSIEGVVRRGGAPSAARIDVHFVAAPRGASRAPGRRRTSR
jgi:hypothetical protein